MAGSKSDTYENLVLQHLFKSDYTAPDPTYVALFTVAPTDSTGGTEVSAAVWTNYTRISVARNTGWTLTGNAIENAATVDFGTAAITGTAPVVVAWALMDAAAAGNILYWGDLTASKTINNGDPTSFAAGAIDVTES